MASPYDYFKSLCVCSQVNSLALRVGKVAVYYLLSGHVIACMWFFVARYGPINQPTNQSINQSVIQQRSHTHHCAAVRRHTLLHTTVRGEVVEDGGIREVTGTWFDDIPTALVQPLHDWLFW